MPSLTQSRFFRPTPILGLAGIGWNLFGAVQFTLSLQATPESLMEQGMTAEQAAVMTGYPLWMTLASGSAPLAAFWAACF